MQLKGRQTGFTLVELLVVIAIIGILTSLVSVNVLAARKKGRDHARQADLASLAVAFELYRSENRAYPLPQPNPTLVDITTLQTKLVPRYTSQLPDSKGGPIYQYATNALGSKFVLDATLEQADYSPLSSITTQYTQAGESSFFRTGFYKVQGKLHYRLSS